MLNRPQETVGIGGGYPDPSDQAPHGGTADR